MKAMHKQSHPSFLFDVAYRIGLAAAPLRGGLCSAGVTASIYHKSPQISMLACAGRPGLAPGAPELLLCIEWKHYHWPDSVLWHWLRLIIPCRRINSRSNSLVGGWRETAEHREDDKQDLARATCRQQHNNTSTRLVNVTEMLSDSK